MPKLVLVTMPFHEELIKKLRAVAPELEVDQYPVDADHPLGEYDRRHEVAVLYAGFSDAPDPADIPAVEWIQLHSAGVDHWLGAPILEQDVVITTASGIHQTPIAEFVFAQILALRYRIPRMLRYQAEHRWPDSRWEAFAVPELRGDTLGIVGYGSIGQEVARLGAAFGMEVVATRRDPETGSEEAQWRVAPDWDDSGVEVLPAAALHDLLARSDFVVLALPLTDETRHMLDAKALRAMQPTAYLLNIARGGVVDEDALADALREGVIAGAGLDVFETEPLPADSPLWNLENVIVSPHVSGFTPRYDVRATDLFAENLRRYVGGEPLFNRFDPQRGY